MKYLTLPDQEAIILGVVRDADHSLTYDLILKRTGFASDVLDELISRLVEKKKITTLAGDETKHRKSRRYLTVSETLEAVEGEVARHLWEMSARGLLFFAYGSDLDPTEMYNKHCPGSQFLCKGSLEGFDLTFDQYQENWRGMLCSIKFSKGEKRVWGALYAIQEKDWQTLDQLESIPHLYRRVSVPVQTVYGLFCAQCYQSIPGGKGLPSKEYLEKMINGASFFGLPQQYIRIIKSLPVQPE